jgi:hypothetical protein
MTFTRGYPPVLGAAPLFPSDSLTSTAGFPARRLGPLSYSQGAIYVFSFLPAISVEGVKEALREMPWQ